MKIERWLIILLPVFLIHCTGSESKQYEHDITKNQSADTVLYAENQKAYKNPPFDVHFQIIDLKREGEILKKVGLGETLIGGGVLNEGDNFIIRLVPNQHFKGNEEFYFSLLELQPDNIFNLVYPVLGRKMLKISTEDTTTLPDIYNIAPPYGQEKFISIFSPKPLTENTEYLIEPTSPEKDSISSNKMLITDRDILWLLAGRPPEVLKDCYYSITTYEIIPKGEYSNVMTHNQERIANRFNEELFVKKPIISILKPLLMQDSLKAPHTIVSEFRLYSLEGTADAKYGVASVAVNNIEANLNKIGEYTYYWSREVKLSDGINSFDIQATTPNGYTTYRSLRLDYSQGSAYADNKTENYLLVIGVDDYRHLPKLSKAVKDALDISKVLVEKYQFPTSNTIVVESDSATKLYIDNVFRSLIQRVDENDNILVYFAGHGFYDDILDEGYWIPVEAHKGVTSEYIPNSTIYKYMKALRSRHTLVIADACFSGAFYTQDQRSIENAYTTKVEKFRSKWVFTSGRVEKVDDAMYGSENSPFATYLLRYLDENRESSFPTSTMVHYVKTAVANNSNQTPIAAPLKDIGDEGGEFVFRLKKSL